MVRPGFLRGSGSLGTAPFRATPSPGGSSAPGSPQPASQSPPPHVRRGGISPAPKPLERQQENKGARPLQRGAAPEEEEMLLPPPPPRVPLPAALLLLLLLLLRTEAPLAPRQPPEPSVSSPPRAPWARSRGRQERAEASPAGRKRGGGEAKTRSYHGAGARPRLVSSVPFHAVPHPWECGKSGWPLGSAARVALGSDALPEREDVPMGRSGHRSGGRGRRAGERASDASCEAGQAGGGRDRRINSPLLFFGPLAL